MPTSARQLTSGIRYADDRGNDQRALGSADVAAAKKTQRVFVAETNRRVAIGVARLLERHGRTQTWAGRVLDLSQPQISAILTTTSDRGLTVGEVLAIETELRSEGAPVTLGETLRDMGVIELPGSTLGELIRSWPWVLPGDREMLEAAADIAEQRASRQLGGRDDD